MSILNLIRRNAAGKIEKTVTLHKKPIVNDIYLSEMKRVYASGVISLDRSTMELIVGKVVDTSKIGNTDYIVIANQLEKSNVLHTCYKTPAIKYSDEALAALCKLTRSERRLLFMPMGGGHCDIPQAFIIKSYEGCIAALKANGFFKSAAIKNASRL